MIYGKRVWLALFGIAFVAFDGGCRAEAAAAHTAVARQAPVEGRAPITSRLEQPGRVSLGIYDAQERRIRELLRAKEMQVRAHTAWWDGLGRDGNRMTADFERRLASSPGLKSEFITA